MSALSMTSSIATRPVLAKRTAAARPQRMVTSAGYIGCPTNLVMVANIAATLAMGRSKFSPLGVLVPSGKKEAYAAAVVEEKAMFSDPSGFNGAQLLAFGSLGHAHGVGMVLGLKAMGML
jgi:photosystem I reaction center PsaK